MIDFQAVMKQFLDVQHAILPSWERERRPQRTAAAPLFTKHLASIAAPSKADAPVARPLSSDRESTTAGSLGELASGRYRVLVTDRPASGKRASLARDHVIAITDDGSGIATDICKRLEGEGYRPVKIVSHSGGVVCAPDASTIVQPLRSSTDAATLVGEIVRRFGRICALVHVSPLSSSCEHEPSDDAREPALVDHTRLLFLLCQAMASELEAAAQNGGSVILACSGLGGGFGYGEQLPSPSLALHGGISGFTKCLALEWPSVRIRTVDLNPSEAVEALAAHIVDELWTDGQEPEVGYLGGRRVAPDVVSAPVQFNPNFDLPRDAVILATGGARGITAEVCVELAERYQPLFVIVGQSPLPQHLEPPDTASLTEPSEIKRALIERLRRAQRVSPALVEHSYRQLEKEREIRSNLAAISAAGARLHYVQLDVRDSQAFGQLVDDVYRIYGRLDGVIHGAGVIEDKLVRDKSLESFERVFSTKASSAMALARALKPEGLRFLVFFSSVAGRFGNRGQSDYAAANEVMGRLAVLLNRRWSGRVCSIAWAPWDKRGMVSQELKHEFRRRGVALVSAEAGRRLFLTEIQQPGGADAEIVVGGGGSPLAPKDQPASPAEQTRSVAAPCGNPLPLMRHACREAAESEIRFTRLIDPCIDRYLHDHRLDGRPVLPLAVATELMAEAAQAAWPDLTVVGVRDLRLFKGIVVDDAPVPTVVTVRQSRHEATDGLIESVVDLTTPTLPPSSRYRAVIQLADRFTEPAPFQPPMTPLNPLSRSLGEAYREWTFHGPMFQRVISVIGLGADAIAGHLFSSTSVPVLTDVAQPRWIIDPFVFDAALQLILMWSRAQNDLTALPSRFEQLRRYGSLSDRPVACYARIESRAGGYALNNNIYFVDHAGQLLAMVQNIEASCSAALNRLSATESRLSERDGQPA
jgi:NAD(P)-dependent dehydrogenase (short-subunit alcohol dehydrogenase family)